jgi:Plasmid recombination enzyme
MTTDTEVIHTDDWREGLRFGLKTLSIKSVTRAEGDWRNVLPVCLRHNLRTNNHDHRHRNPIDPMRSLNNEVLLGSNDPEVAAELALSMLCKLGIIVRRCDTIVAVELVFQPPRGHDMPEFYETCLTRVRGRYQYIVSAVVHRDQKRPHMHVIVLAIQNGRFCGAEMTSRSNRLEAQRSDFMAHIRRELGLRPDRVPPTPPSAMRKVFTSAGKGPKSHAAAARRDAELLRRAPLPAGGNALASEQPNSPVPSGQPHGPDLILRGFAALSALITEGVAVRAFHPTAAGQITAVPSPAGPAVAEPPALQQPSGSSSTPKKDGGAIARPTLQSPVNVHTRIPTGPRLTATFTAHGPATAPARPLPTSQRDWRPSRRRQGPSSIAGPPN